MKTPTIWIARLQPDSDLQAGDSFAVALQRSAGGLRRLEARIGSLTANQEWFKVWRTIEGECDAPKTALELEMLVRGVFEQRRFLDLLQHFIVFEEDPDRGAAAQDHRRLSSVPRRECGGGGNGARERHDRRSRVREAPGTYWAGKMQGGKAGRPPRWRRLAHARLRQESFDALLRRRIMRHPAMQNPTLVVLTDRNDLDDQLFGQFQRCHEIAAANAGAGRAVASICANCSTSRAAAWCSRRSRNSCRRDGREDADAYRIAGTSSSSPTKRTAASTT